MIIRSKTPLRIGIVGGGTDVSPFCDKYGGCVLNITINLFSYCTLIPTNNDKIKFISPDRNIEFESASTPSLKIDDVLPLHKGIYNRIVQEYNFGKPLSFEMITYSDAPSGSGLGTSSTMVVTILKAFQEWLNLPLGEYDLAQLAYNIERKDLNFAGGKQDQYAATFGGLNFMEFYSDDRVIVNPLRLKKWIKNEIECSIILFYIGNSRDSGKIINEQKKSLENMKALEGMFEIKAQTALMKEFFLKAEFDKIAECLNKNWLAKKKTSSSISNDKIEEIYEYIMKRGAKAAKISGAGGGGFMLIWCDPKNRYKLVEDLENLKEGFVRVVSFVEYGAQAWTLYDEK